MAATAPLSTLAATVAHELVTPLAIIASATSLLERVDPRERSPEEFEEILGTIRRNVAVAQVVVEALRNLDHDGRDIELHRRETRLPELVRSTVADLQRTLLRDHPTEVVGPDLGLLAHVDPVRVRQVLFNLLSNAAKFSPEGRRVNVQLEGVGDLARITVRDEGRGIAPVDADRIFEKWERLDSDTTGLGVGLHLSRAIARAHGGDLRLGDAPEGAGAGFVLELPLRVSDRDGSGDSRG